MSSKPISPTSAVAPRISLQGVGKLFYKQEQKTFKEFLPALLSGKNTAKTFWALHNLDLDVKQGETIGIIGPNGSGKSTILKLIAGVSRPTEGKVIVNGRIAPLIELGAGFHPELTGRENVYLNGVILGLKHKEIDAQFDSIVDFAELREFIDQPIKHYSSGMYLRLAFAVAVHTQPQVLLVDEILAVGDMNFQEKCIQRMRTFQKEGVSIILVTHSMERVTSFCDRCLYMKHGAVVDIGKPEDVIAQYLQGAKT